MRGHAMHPPTHPPQVLGSSQSQAERKLTHINIVMKLNQGGRQLNLERQGHRRHSMSLGHPTQEIGCAMLTCISDPIVLCNVGSVNRPVRATPRSRARRDSIAVTPSSCVA